MKNEVESFCAVFLGKSKALIWISF